MSIRKLPNGRWEARARVEGRHLKKVFERKTDAVAWEATVRHDRDRGLHVDMANRITVAEYFQQWIDARVIRDATRRQYRNLLNVHLKPLPLGSRPLVKARPSEIQAWARDRASVIGPYGLRIKVGVLRSAFTSAVDDGLIARNPVVLGRLSLPKVDKPKIVPLTIAQVQEWAEHAAACARAMILVQAGLGLRISELLALRVQDIDFLRREVHITEQLAPDGRRAPLKTANSRRVVPLPSVTSEAVAEHIRQYPPGPGGLIFTRVYAEFTRNGRRNAPPNRRPDGSWPQAAASHAYRAAARAARLPDSVTSHDLRHHYASVLLDAGESVHAVAARIGDTPEMVLSVYGHLMPDREDTTRKAIDAAWKAAERAAPGAQGGQDHR